MPPDVSNGSMKHFIYLLILILAASCKDSRKVKRIQAPYIVDHPLKIPTEFGGGQITTMNGISFSNNGKILYISKSIDKTFDNGRQYAAIFKYTYENDHWKGPKLIEFGRNIDAYHPVLSMDNEMLFYCNALQTPSGPCCWFV